MVTNKMQAEARPVRRSTHFWVTVSDVFLRTATLVWVGIVACGCGLFLGLVVFFGWLYVVRPSAAGQIDADMWVRFFATLIFISGIGAATVVQIRMMREMFHGGRKSRPARIRAAVRRAVTAKELGFEVTGLTVGATDGCSVTYRRAVDGREDQEKMVDNLLDDVVVLTAGVDGLSNATKRDWAGGGHVGFGALLDEIQVRAASTDGIDRKYLDRGELLLIAAERLKGALHNSPDGLTQRLEVAMTHSLRMSGTEFEKIYRQVSAQSESMSPMP